MAGRKNKHTVDYFPHYCGNNSKTLFIIENRFGLKGYAIWYKTLELLGSTEHHFIDLRDETDLLFIISKMKITEQDLNDIYDLLAKLNAIDKELWNNRIVFSENFINNIEDAYARRKGIDVLHKYDLCKHLLIKCKHKLPNEIKGNKNKKKYIYNNFYDEQIALSDNDANYIRFVKYIFGDNDLKHPYEKVLAYKEQLTFEQLKKLSADLVAKKRRLLPMIDSIENGNYKNTSLYLTFKAWLRRAE